MEELKKGLDSISGLLDYRWIMVLDQILLAMDTYFVVCFSYVKCAESREYERLELESG